jgi:hypothetical protein
VQVDNYNATPTHVFVGIVSAVAPDAPSSCGSGYLAAAGMGNRSSSGALRSITSHAFPSGVKLSAHSADVSSEQSGDGGTSSSNNPVEALDPAASTHSESMSNSTNTPKWGTWVRLPGETSDFVKERMERM